MRAEFAPEPDPGLVPGFFLPDRAGKIDLPDLPIIPAYFAHRFAHHRPDRLFSRSHSNPKEDFVNVRHLNQRELAERWNLSEATLERWRSMDIGPPYLKLHGRVLYRLADIEAYEIRHLRRSQAICSSVGGAA
jgi:hypothetical protein